MPIAAILALFLAVPHPQASPTPLCEAAIKPYEGQRVSARGTLIIGLHGSAFTDLERRCSVGILSGNDVAWGEIARISYRQCPAGRLDLTIEGRLSWYDALPGEDPALTRWHFVIESFADAECLLQPSQRYDTDKWGPPFGKNGYGS